MLLFVGKHHASEVVYVLLAYAYGKEIILYAILEGADIAIIS